MQKAIVSWALLHSASLLSLLLSGIFAIPNATQNYMTPVCHDGNCVAFYESNCLATYYCFPTNCIVTQCDVLPNKPFKDENPKIIYIDISKRPISNLSLSFNYVIYFILFFVDAFTWWRICATTITTTSGLLRVWCVCLSTH